MPGYPTLLILFKPIQYAEIKMKEIKWYFGILLSSLSAFLLLFSFPTYDIYIFAFFALVPVFLLTYTSTIKKTLVYGIIAGFSFYTLYLFWMNAYLAVVGVTFSTIIFGGYFALALILINFTGRVFPRYRVVLTPFIWISIEYLRSFGFLSFTFGSVGYTQHNFLRFIQIADIGGEPIVSFIVVLFNASLTNMILKIIKGGFPLNKGYLKHSIPLFISSILIIISIIYGSIRINVPIPENPKMKISLVQALSSPRSKWEEEKWQTLNRLIKLSKESYRENPDVDLIVWTETAIRTSLGPNLASGTPYHTRIKSLIRSLSIPFIIGSPDNYFKNQEKSKNPDNLPKIYPGKDKDEVWTNSAYLLNSKGEIVDKYDKIKLTPFGEHFPIGKALPFLQKILDKFTDSAGFTPGNRFTIFKDDKLSFSVVICWEGTYGYFIRKFVERGADFIINISNDMWTETRAGHFQHFTITKFRAIENRIWYVRAGNDGVTAFVSPHGEVVKILPIKEVGFLAGEVGPRAHKTFYTKNGDILPSIGLVISGIALLFSIFLFKRIVKQFQ